VAESRARRRTSLVVAAALMAVPALAGCSSGTESYCAALKDDQKRLTRLATAAAKPGKQGARALDDTLGVLEGLGAEAPEDIADEWQTLTGALQGLVDAITETGASPADFAGGEPPPGVSTGQVRAVQQAAAELRSTRVTQAGASIEQHARDVCKVDLGTGLGGVS
jgi:hypothetical protein